MIRETIKLKGIVRDIEPIELMPGSPAPKGVHSPNTWTSGQNVTFDDDAAQRVKGYAPFAAPSMGSPVFQLNVLTPTKSYWLYVDESGPYAQIWVTDGQDHWNLSPNPVLNSDPQCNDPTQWSGDNFVVEDGVIKATGWAVATGIARNEGFTYETGTDYELHYDIVSMTAGANFGGIVRGTTGTGRTAPGSYSDTITAGGGISYVGMVTVAGGGPYDGVFDNIFAYGVVEANISKNAGRWTGCLLNGLPVLNNGIDPPMWWDGDTSNAMQPLPDWPANTSARSIRAFKYHLIAMDITTDSVQIPEKVMWSAAADPGTVPQSWTPLPENDAGDNILADTTGGVVDGLALRDVFVLYKNHSTYYMQYIAGTFVFQFHLLFPTTGTQTTNCVAEMDGKHWVYTDDDIIVHDGNTFQSIADNVYRSYVQNSINPDQQHFAHVAVDLPKGEFWVCFPTDDDRGCDTAAIFSTEAGVWGNRSLPEVAFTARGIIPDDGASGQWDQQTQTWATISRYWDQRAYNLTNDKLVFSNFAGLYEVDGANDAAGEPVEAFIERLYWTQGGERGIWYNDTLRSIYPHITGTEGDMLTVRVGSSRGASGGIEWQLPQQITIGGVTGIDVLTTGRFTHLRFESSGGQPWQLHRMLFEYVQKGKW